MRPLYHRFQRSGWGCLDPGITASRETPSVSARRPPRRDAASRASSPPTSEDDRSPSPRVQDAAARLRSGEVDVDRIAHLTGVPAALVDLMKQTAATGPPARGDAPDRRAVPCANRRARARSLSTAAGLGAVVIGCDLVGIGAGRPAVGKLGAAAAVLTLLGCHLAGRTRHRR